VDGIITTTITADAAVTLHFDVLITDIDPLYDYYGKLPGEAYSFPGITVTGNFIYDASTSSFIFDAAGTNVTTDLIGVSLALGVDVNGVDAALQPVTTADPNYLDVIKFNSNEFLNAFANINITLNNGVLTHDLTFVPALLSGGIQDAYLDPAFSLLMVPDAATTNTANASVILNNTFDATFDGWYGVSGGLIAIDDFSVSTNSLLSYNRSSLFSGFALDAKNLLQSNQQYTLEADVFVSGTTDGKFMPRVKSRTGAKTTYTLMGREILTPGVWHRVSMPFAMPDISQASLVELQLNGVLASANFYIDNLQILGAAPATNTGTTGTDTTTGTGTSTGTSTGTGTGTTTTTPGAFILNDDYETGKQGWSNVGGVSSIATNGQASASSILQTNRTSSMHGLVKSVKGNVASNTTYILDADVFLAGTTSGNLIAEIKSRVGAKNILTRVGKRTIQPGSWNHITFEVTLPNIDGASIVDLKFYGIASKRDFSLDNIQLIAK
jgi:hypothetical protein